MRHKKAQSLILNISFVQFVLISNIAFWLFTSMRKNATVTSTVKSLLLLHEIVNQIAECACRLVCLLLKMKKKTGCSSVVFDSG